MGSTKGYYSIIQYCPDASRLEAVNVGVALFCPEIRWLKARFGRRRTPISHLFGRRDWDFLALQQNAIEARFEQEKESFTRLEDLETYISRRANALTLTSPRSVKVDNPEVELGHLLQRLVGPTISSAEHAPSLTKELGDQLRLAGLSSRLKRDVVVRPPSLPRPVKASFAYQNGRLNLIDTVQLEGQTPAGVFSRLSVRAVEGELLRDYNDPQYGQVGLVVVAKFGPDQRDDEQRARTVFQKHDVPLYTFEGMQSLIDEIRLRAH